MSLRVLSAVGDLSLQGSAIYGRARYGVPPGGAFDSESLLLANALLGNGEAAPSLELALGAIEVEAVAEITLAVVGAACSMSLNGSPVVANASLKLSPGDRLAIGSIRDGARVYIAAPGGFDGDVKSNLFAGDRRSPAPHRLSDPPTSLDTRRIRCTLGPHQGLLAPPLESSKLKVSPHSNRMGVRLSPTVTEHSCELASEPSCPGVVQLTPGGELIVLGPDGPTIGGYPKVAVVCRADLDRIGQLSPGEDISFKVVSLEEAHQLQKLKTARLAKQLVGLKLLIENERFS